MRILIDILHPAHVHFFRGFRSEMLDRGHEILVTARDKDVTLQLLEAGEIPHRSLSVRRSGFFGLGRELAQRTRRLGRIVKVFQPDVLTGIMGPGIALVGRMRRIPAVVFYDTEMARATNSWVFPLASAVCTPDAYAARVRGNHVRYAGYHELAYLHPDRFVPDAARLAAFGLEPPFSVARFVSWEASHDAGTRGLSVAQQRTIIDRLAAHGTVAVSAEDALPDDLEGLRLSGPVWDIHHVLAHAQIVVGESRTMASEAALLGTPSVLVVRRSAGVIADQERRGLVQRFSPAGLEGALAAIDAVGGDRLEDERQRLLAEKIDVTEWMVGFFEDRRWETTSKQ